MELNMEINNIKCIKNLTFSFPLEAGIYAITGENGSGKSTLISCASSVFYQMPMTEYFGRPNDASIEFSLGEATRKWGFDGKKWEAVSSAQKMKINGFYEGSIIFGNRFRDTKLSIINVLDNLSRDEIRNMSCEPRMLEKRDDDVYFTELPINYHGSKVRWSLFYLYDELNDLEKEKFSSRTIYIPVTVDSVVRLYTNKVRKKEK